MPARWHPLSCRICGVAASADEPISATGLCYLHGRQRLEANNEQLAAHSGPFFDHWRRQTARAVGAITIDELEQLADDCP